MIVTMKHKGRSITGLSIGTSDVRRYFPCEVPAIDLELDDLRIRCDLKADFWLDQPEISDRRLGAWLEKKFLWPKLPGTPLSVEMVPDGDSYRLLLVRAAHRVRSQA